MLAVSDEAGVYIAKSTNSRHFFVFGHPEYDRATLNSEYERDVARGLDIAVPAHYYPDDNPANAPKANWRAHAQLLYTNWRNYDVYQTTPYEVERAGTDEEETLAEDAAHRENAAKAAAKRAQGKAAAAKPAKSASADHAKRKPAIADEFARAANEDDDGYDPYSDRREVRPLFEPDPWK